ncbi:MAG: aminoglycoside 6-adenylyltransferase [Anaerolineae bacterium]|nr:aminoglycoside 6-adenylyltransferase [Anaerolineae bacterium]
MGDKTDEQEILERLIRWGEGQPLVRAMLLTSSRAVPGASVDLFSDYDVILALSDIQPFYADRGWLGAFGTVLALYRDPLDAYASDPTAGYVTQYEDGLKVDFSLWSLETLQRVVADPQLPDELDAGYRVLLDKDGLTVGLQPPSYGGYIPKPPSASEYHDMVETFLLEATYVAKLLWRDDLVAAKHILDNMMKQEQLIPMLAWRAEIDRHWSLKPGPYGRGLKKWLRPDLWAELERTYVGADLEANWEALYSSIALLRRAALEVGAHLGYPYPHDLDRRTLAYLHKVQALDRGAERLQCQDE